jgi:hypothetical protein
MIAIPDITSLNYLSLIGSAGILPAMFGKASCVLPMLRAG